MTDKQPEALRLTDWYDEDEGFCQGTKAPHKWVLQANSELRRLHEVNAELVDALQNIANANPSQWDDEVRDQFQQWAQNRARYAIAKATGEQL